MRVSSNRDTTMTPSDPNTTEFFTWVLEDFATQHDVPERLREHMRVMWLAGLKTEVIALVFETPVEWVEDFVREAPRKAERPN
jgi:hypothetical protein